MVVGGGVDYHVDSYVVKFAAGETSVPLNVMIIHDDLCELNEAFTLEIDQYSIMIEDVNVAYPYHHTVVTIVDECMYIFIVLRMSSVDNVSLVIIQ